MWAPLQESLAAWAPLQESLAVWAPLQESLTAWAPLQESPPPVSAALRFRQPKARPSHLVPTLSVQAQSRQR